MRTVTLNEWECEMAQLGAFGRRSEADKKGRKDRYGTPEMDLWTLEVESCAGEIAVAKGWGRYWTPVVADVSEAPHDVSGAYDEHGRLLAPPMNVRQTERQTGGLLFHRADTGLFVLACGTLPTFNCYGPVTVDELKVDGWWRADLARPAYLVPQDVVETIAEGALA